MFANSALRTAAIRNLVDPEICRIAQHIVSESMAPCVSICVAKHRSDGWQLATGTAGGLRARIPVALNVDTPFDLASLTKPCVALAAATLARKRQICLKSPLGSYLPELSPLPVAHATLEMLLSHRSGLKAHLELFGNMKAKLAIGRRTLLQIVGKHGYSTVFSTERAGQALYSDLGYLLAGAAMERYLRVPLDELIADQLCRRLGLAIGSSRQWREAVPEFVHIVAPTEHVAWRGGVIRGQVHDENAWAFSGHGLAGHAGLFGTAFSVAVLGCATLDALAGRYSSLDRFAAYYCTGWRNGGTQRAGFDSKSQSRSSAGSQLSSCSFGHLGFTGTSLWCDPMQRIVIALLTNRVCPSRQNSRLLAARGALHDSLVRCATGTVTGDS